MSESTVFYAWQDDHPGTLNRHFIHDCLKRAIKDLNRGTELFDLIVDRDTRNVAGMPDIGQTVLQKIDKAAVVVADLTIINPTTVRRPHERPVSNPNVLFELGYALGTLGSHCLIGVFNAAYGAVEELPFDLRPKRMMQYTLSNSDDKTKTRHELVADLKRAIDLCLGESADERIQRNSKIVQMLIELVFIGLEINEWQGVPRLPQMLEEMRSATDELCRLVVDAQYTTAAQNIAHNVSRKMSTAARLALNDENWPTIKENVRTAGELAGFLQSQLAMSLDSESHEECLGQIRSMPANIDHQINAESFNLRELDDLSTRLRKWAFVSLVPEHPAFTDGLKTVSFDLRLCVLQWAKRTPDSGEVRSSLEDIGRRLSDLIASYCSAVE